MTLISGMKFFRKDIWIFREIEEGNYRDKLNKIPKQKHKAGLIRLHMVQTSQTLTFVQYIVGFSPHPHHYRTR